MRIEYPGVSALITVFLLSGCAGTPGSPLPALRRSPSRTPATIRPTISLPRPRWMTRW